MILNYKRTIFIGFAFMSICSFSVLYDSVVPLILENTFGMKQTLTGTVMALDNILAMFMLPLFGSFSDKVSSRFGKRTPFIVLGTLVAVCSMIFMPLADEKGNLAVFFVALGVVLVAMSTYRSPAVALMPDLTPKPLRSKANAIINLMGAVGGVYTLIMIKLLVPKVAEGEKADYTFLFISVAVLMVIAVILLLLTINENKLRNQIVIEETETVIVEGKERLPNEVKKSLVFLLLSVSLWFIAYNAVQSTFSRYVEDFLGIKGGVYATFLMVGTIAAVISYIPIGIFSNKIGRKKIILIGITVMTLGFLFAIPLRSNSILMNMVFIMVGIGWAAINVNSYPMVVEMSKGSDIGKYTGFYYTFSMSAQVITPILSGFLIEKLDIGYMVLFPYAAIFSALAFITMCYVKHGDTKPLLKKSLIENIGGDD
ncbi:MAG: MFS transporter [Clostridiales bacterium GWF2_36_10]|nr:MAG: MFS transporter [Clostridiales bacterium GWF2_36_10]HAN20115.1 MFS transporter [Clostridiales bacterium]